MNANRFTEKLQEALGRAQNAALNAHNQAVDVEHLLASLLEDNEGLASSILKLTGVDRDAVSRKLSAELAKIPHVTGGGADSGQVYATQRLGRVLSRAEQEAGKLKDEYVSVEHVLIAMLDEPGAASKILREAGLTHDKLMAVLQKVRGNQRVTSSNP
jgi:ATP-dependent Clp protease ATP-binding subunit ClpB